MKYATRNAGDIEKKRVDENWGSLMWLANRKLGNSEDLTLGLVTLKPGHSNPRRYHPNCEEVLYFLRGHLAHSAGKEKNAASDETAFMNGATITIDGGTAI